MRFPSRYSKTFAVGGALLLLAGCAVPRTLASFQTPEGTIALQQSVEGGHYSVAVGPRTSLPLDGYASAQIDSVWNLPPDRLVVITGAGADCGLRYTLVTAHGDTASLHDIGDCGDSYGFTRDGDTVAVRQTGVSTPKIWTFRDGALNGPTVLVASRPARTTTAPPPPLRPAEAGGDAISPPTVSAPVGDEVIPSPVGGAGASRSGP
jgi:hypothetical protein